VRTQISVLYKLPILGYFVIAAHNELIQLLCHSSYWLSPQMESIMDPIKPKAVGAELEGPQEVPSTQTWIWDTVTAIHHTVTSQDKR
jgi:hypothetical protein